MSATRKPPTTPRVKPRTLLHVRVMNGDHEVVLRVDRRVRVLILAAVLLVIFNGGAGSIEKIVQIIDLLGKLL